MMVYPNSLPPAYEGLLENSGCCRQAMLLQQHPQMKNPALQDSFLVSFKVKPLYYEKKAEWMLFGGAFGIPEWTLPVWRQNFRIKRRRNLCMRLLLAEDERSLSKAIVTILEKNNYSADAVYDGVEALEYLESGNYDGLILDIMMPRMDGLTVLKKLHEKGNTIPVLMLTAKSEVDDKVQGLDMGANDYLTKPFATRELLARIRAMTRNQMVQPVSQLTMGNITLDQATFELSSPAGSFRLANKEYQMLEMMIRNPRQIISAERFWRESGDMTARQRSTWCGYIFHI